MSKVLAKGLNANQIKWIALIFMTIDHINGYIFAFATGAENSVLSALGRISAPLFLFVLTESIRHTKDKKRLILRLYIAGVLGSIFTLCFIILMNEFVLPGPVYMGVPDNILFTYAYTAIYICLLERGMKAVRTKNLKGIFVTTAGVIATFFPQLVYYIYDETVFRSIEVGFVSLEREVLAAFFRRHFLLNTR